TIAGSTGGAQSGATFQASGATLNVNQNQTRVVIDWSSFNIAPGETVNFNQAAANWIAFNRVPSGARMNIDGAINATGGVFLFSNGGMTFGGGANVNVGTFFATIASGSDTNQLVNDGGALNICCQSNFAPGTSIDVAAGARIRANSGFAGLSAQQINQGGTISASDSVAYFLGEGANLQFSLTATGGSRLLTSSTMNFQSGRGRPGMNHTGSSSGQHVTVRGGSITHSEPGWNALINLDGVMSASGVIAGGTDGIFIYGAGPSDGIPNPSGSGFVDTRDATLLSTTGNITILSPLATFGSATAGGNILLQTLGDLTVASGATIRANTLNTPVSSQAVTNNQWNMLVMSIQGRLNIAAGAHLIAGSAVGGVETRTGLILAGSQARTNVFEISPANVDVSGRVEADYVQLFANGGSDPNLGGSLRLRGQILADEQAGLFASRYLVIDRGAEVSGGLNRAIAWNPTSTWPVMRGAVDPEYFVGVVLTGQDMAIEGTVRSGTASRPDVIDVRPWNNDDSWFLGGADDPPTVEGLDLRLQFRLSDREFQNLRAYGIGVYPAVPQNVPTEMPEVWIEDLSINTDVTRGLFVGTFRSDLIVAGNVKASAPDVADLVLGAMVLTSTPDSYGSLTPENIYIVGSIGEGNAFKRVGLIAHNDIVMGTEVFAYATVGDPAFSASSASLRFDPPKPNHVWINTGQLQLATMGRVLQQNTARFGGAGLRIGSPQPGAELIIAPFTGGAIPGADWTPHYENGPARVELFGVLADSNLGAGRLTRSASLVDPEITGLTLIQINGCAVGGGCAEAEPPTRIEVPVTLSVDDFAPPEDGPASSDRVINSVPFAFANKADEEEDERDEDVAGSGNPDLWPITPGGLK
ncbi:MAG TPA: filamentous hemagglutinin N-terminal domain-containing protein, partial [Phenylobacterium sp.]